MMNIDYQIPEPFIFNPIKHHIGFIKEYIIQKTEEEFITDTKNLVKEIKHVGSSVADVYSGSLLISNICKEIQEFLQQNNISDKTSFSSWAGTNVNNFKIIILSDGSQWTLKYYDNICRFVHFFPSRYSRFTFRVKSNTLKSALLYYILIGKDFITVDDLNKVRTLFCLSPVKNNVDSEAIVEMIEKLRDQTFR